MSFRKKLDLKNLAVPKISLADITIPFCDTRSRQFYDHFAVTSLYYRYTVVPSDVQ
nr:hypothetical protein [uncultured Desulfobacter sp.]